MLTIRTILFPTDLSKRAKRAHQVARALARVSGARLIVLHVVDRVSVAEERVAFDEAGRPAPMPGHPRSHHEALEERLRELYTTPKLPMGFLVRDGDAAEEILRAAAETKASLIVMGTHGRTGLDRMLMGSVAEAVLRKAGCPVLIVKSPDRNPAPTPDLQTPAPVTA